MQSLYLLLLGCIMAECLCAQDLNWDEKSGCLVFRPVFPKMPGRIIFGSEFDYSLSLSGCFFLNGQAGGTAGQLAFIQNLRYKIKLSSKRFQVSGDFVHNLGMIYFIDSTAKIQTDDNTLTARLSFEAAKYVQFTASSILVTKFFNARELLPGSDGTLAPTICSSFCTPLVCTFSGGFGFVLKKTGSLDIGLGSARLTYIMDRGIFERTGRDACFGVEKGHDSFFEYGLSLHLLIDRNLGSNLQWNCDLLLFKAGNSAVDLTLKNLFAFRINRFIRTSLQTKLFYDEDVNLMLRMENLVTVGFGFHL